MPKILIVDDDRAIAELVSDALEDEGFSTVLAHDGKTALSLIPDYFGYYDAGNGWAGAMP